MKKHFILIFTLILLSGCLSNRSNNHDWTGFYYPNKNKIDDESTWVIQPGFKTLKDCQEWVLFEISGNNTNFDYECGYKCRYDNSYKMTICEETIK
jgi:hypothetical protein